MLILDQISNLTERLNKNMANSTTSTTATSTITSKKILCIGDIVLDIIPSSFPIAKEKVLIDGETFVDSVTFQRGGCGGNFVCVLKSIYPNAEVEFVSRTGDDSNADFLVKQMESYGVKPIFIRDSTVSTQVTIAVSYLDGERHFITFLGGLDNFNIEDLPDTVFDKVNHLAYRGIWFAEKLLLKSAVFLKKAVQLGIPISMDLGFDPFWNKDPKVDPSAPAKIKQRREAALNALPYVKYLFGNEMEFLNLTDSKGLDEAIKILLKTGVENIVMHRGSKGAAIITHDMVLGGDTTKEYGYIEIPAAKVDVVNPVGSGDTFDSILIALIVEGKPIIDAAVIASAGAALSLQSPAGTKITLEKINEFVKLHPTLLNLLSS
jgi:ribokinase